MEERVSTPEAVERLVRSTGLPAALHADGPDGNIDRYYVLHEEHLPEQIRRALEAAEKNKADGVLVLPFPNCRRMPARPP